MDWTQLVGVASVIVTNLITIVTLYIHLDNKTENRLAKMDDTIAAIRDDMKEFQKEMTSFHVRMERQSAEFNIRMEKQDAEFKGKFLLLEEKMMNKG